MAARVTVVNDDPDFLELMRDILDMDQYVTTTVDGDPPGALDRIRASRPDVLMIDLRIGSDALHGWDVAQEVRADPELARVPILVCSADIVALREMASDVAQYRQVATLEKPFTIDQLIESVDSLLVSAAHR